MSTNGRPRAATDASRPQDHPIAEPDTLDRRDAESEWRTSPVSGRGLVVIASTWAVVSLVLIGIGLALVAWWESSELGRADTDVNRWLADRRTPLLDELADLGSAFSDTRTILLLGTILLPWLLWRFRRWHEATFIVGVMALESVMYLVPSRLVGRERPSVDQIAGPTTDHSFPSGHVAAAIALYGALATLVCWHSSSTWVRRTAATVALVVPMWVAWSRLYIGAHHVTDYIGSYLMGVAAVVAVAWAVRPAQPPHEAVSQRPRSPHPRSTERDVVAGAGSAIAPTGARR